MRHVTLWAWAALIALVVVIGCGGSGGTPTVSRFVGSWNGTMVGADGSSTQIYIVISETGAISWSTVTGDPNNPIPITETGTIQGSGKFTVTGSTPATSGVTINGTLNQTGVGSVGTSTGCCPNDFLDGLGTMTTGSTQVGVTFHLSGFGSA